MTDRTVAKSYDHNSADVIAEIKSVKKLLQENVNETRNMMGLIFDSFSEIASMQIKLNEFMLSTFYELRERMQTSRSEEDDVSADSLSKEVPNERAAVDVEPDILRDKEQFERPAVPEPSFTLAVSPKQKTRRFEELIVPMPESQQESDEDSSQDNISTELAREYERELVQPSITVLDVLRPEPYPSQESDAPVVHDETIGEEYHAHTTGYESDHSDEDLVDVEVIEQEDDYEPASILDVDRSDVIKELDELKEIADALAEHQVSMHYNESFASGEAEDLSDDPLYDEEEYLQPLPPAKLRPAPIPPFKLPTLTRYQIVQYHMYEEDEELEEELEEDQSNQQLEEVAKPEPLVEEQPPQPLRNIDEQPEEEPVSPEKNYTFEDPPQTPIPETPLRMQPDFLSPKHRSSASDLVVTQDGPNTRVTLTFADDTSDINAANALVFLAKYLLLQGDGEFDASYRSVVAECSHFALVQQAPLEYLGVLIDETPQKEEQIVALFCRAVMLTSIAYSEENRLAEQERRLLLKDAREDCTAILRTCERQVGYKRRFAAFACYYRAIVYELLGEIEKVAIDLGASISFLTDKFAAPYIKRSSMLKRQQQFEAALSDLGQAIEICPEDWELYFKRALLLQNHFKNAELAKVEYSRVLDLNPRHASAHNNLAILYYDNFREYDLAESHFDKAIELKPNNSSFLKNRARLRLNKLRQYDEALIDFNRAIELNPTDDDIYLLRASLFEKLDMPEKAKADRQRAILLKPSNEKRLQSRGMK